MSKNITIPSSLFVAINNLCTGVESKILFSILGYEPDELCPLTNSQIMKLSGFTQNNHYFVNRKKLVSKGYIVIGTNGMHVNTDAIMKDYKEGFKC